MSEGGCSHLLLGGRLARRLIAAAAVALAMLVVAPVAGARDSTAVEKLNAFNAADAAVVQPNGKLIVAGTTARCNLCAGTRVIVLRFTRAGHLDRRFAGDDGYATINTIGGDADRVSVSGLVRQADGRIVIAESPNDVSSEFSVVLVRLTAGGELDRTFGDSGRVRASRAAMGDFEFPPNRDALALAPDGKLLVAGRIYDVGGGGELVGFAAARFGPGGELDGTYGTAGVASAVPPNTIHSNVTSVAAQADGAAILGGVSRPDSQDPSGWTDALSATRFTPDGFVDSRFGEQGWQTILTISGPAPALGIAEILAEDDHVLAVGSAGPGTYKFGPGCPQSVLSRLDGDGALDPTFGQQGVVLASSTAGCAVVDAELDSSGRAIVARGGSSVAIERYTPSGALDSGFGGGRGSVSVRVAGHRTVPSAMEVGPSNEILAVGDIPVAACRGTNPAGAECRAIAVVRLGSNGTLDRRFGNGGFTTWPRLAK